MSGRFRLAFVLCALLSLGFYLWQNHFATRGGDIALVKALWLGFTLFYWLAWPLLVLLFSPLPLPIQHIYRIFWIWMILRAGVEILLMSINAWQYHYGIFHDLSCVVLLGLGYAWIRQKQWRPMAPEIADSLLIMLGMFVVETGFAYYIAQFTPSTEQAELWFIDGQSPHQANLLLTTLVVIALMGWTFYLDRTFGKKETAR